MKNFEELEAFMQEDGWLKKLKPYLKQVNSVPYNNHWLILMYNLFDMPPIESNMFKVLCQCRGTVVDTFSKKVVCAPFVKFFNYGEGGADKVDFARAWYTHKRDGWLFKVLKHKGKYYPFSNGTALVKDGGAPVTSAEVEGLKFKTVTEVFLYALKAQWNSDGLTISFTDGMVAEAFNELEDGSTIMFELESAFNKIYTDLQQAPKAWLIGLRKPNGQEVNVFDTEANSYWLNRAFDTPATYTFKSLKECLDTLKTWTAKDNGEGLVALSVDKDGRFLRVKLKCEDYLKVKYSQECFNLGDNSLLHILLVGESDDLLAAQPAVKDRLDNVKSIYESVLAPLDSLYEAKQKIEAKASDKKEAYFELRKVFGNFANFMLTSMKSPNYKEKLNEKFKRSAKPFDEATKLKALLDVAVEELKKL